MVVASAAKRAMKLSTLLDGALIRVAAIYHPLRLRPSEPPYGGESGPPRQGFVPPAVMVAGRSSTPATNRRAYDSL